MAAAIANGAFIILVFYVGLGVLFAIVFVTRGVGRIDPSAQQGTRGFRLVIFPGVVALWPVLARRWLSGVQSPPEERNAHRRGAARRSEGR